MSKYINPFTDWGFKRLFGQEFSKDLLISFLNDLFEGELHVKDVTFHDKEQLADTRDLRGCIYDVYCETDVMLREKNSDAFFTDKLRFIYLCLPYFKMKAEECVTDFEKWIYVLKHMETLERIPFATQKKIFKRLAEVADSSCLSKEEKEKYEESRNAVDNYNLGIFTAWQEGEQKGELSKSLSIARNMLMEGMPDALVLKMTGLTQAQLDVLKN